MTGTARFSTTDRSIDVVIARHLSPEARATKLAAFAKGRLAEAKAVHRAAAGGGSIYDDEDARPDGLLVI